MYRNIASYKKLMCFKLNKDKIKLLWECHRETFLLWLFTISLTLIPIIVKFGIIVQTEEWSTWQNVIEKGNFFIQGNFYIFSIALLAPSIIVLIEHRKNWGGVRSFLAIFSFIIIVISLIFYSINYFEFYNNGVENLNKFVIQICSLVLFVYSLTVFYISNFIQKKEFKTLNKFNEIKESDINIVFDRRSNIETLKEKIN